MAFKLESCPFVIYVKCLLGHTRFKAKHRHDFCTRQKKARPKEQRQMIGLFKLPRSWSESISYRLALEDREQGLIQGIIHMAGFKTSGSRSQTTHSYVILE